MEYLRTDLEGLELVLRDLEERDIPALVEYWHASGPDYLRSIGVDVGKLTEREDTRQRFLATLRQPPAERSRFTLIIAGSDGTPLAYSNVHVKSPREAYVHAHVLDPRLRRRGLASSVFASVLRIFFTHLGIEVLTFQTSPENEAINRLVQRFGLTPRQVHLDAPDGMARPGLFNVYEIPRELLTRL